MAKYLKTIKNISQKYRLHITGATCFGSFIIGTGKLLTGFIALSFFMCVSAFYTYGIVVAKLCIIKGMRSDSKKHYAYYRLTGIILIIASLLYAIYSARLLWKPENPRYNIYVGITIAAFTFTEIGVNIRGVIVERRNKKLLYHALKMVNLASSLICLVLTQTALLSFTHEDMPSYNPSISNGLMGIMMGIICTLIGCYMLIHIKNTEKKETAL